MSTETVVAERQTHWAVKTLDQCATIQTGVSKGRKTNQEELVSVPYLRVANVQDGYLDLSEIKEIQVRPQEVARYALQPGDVLLTEGGDFDKLGRGFVWNGELPECIHQNHVFAVRVDQSQLDPHFFAYQAQSPHGKQYFLSVAHKTTNLACINTTKLKAFPVRVPPLSEQKEIVRILSTVKRAISAQERIIQTTTELKQALMQKLFSEGLRGEAQKETEIGLVPESWEVVECGDICETISVGIVVQPSSYYVKEGVPAFRSQNVRADRIQVEPMVYISKEANDGPVRKSKLSAGDVLIVRTGYPGTSCVVPPEFEGSNCIDLIFARPDKLRLSSHYLSRFFNSDLAKRQVQAGKTGLAQQHYNVAAVKSTKIPLPSLGEQERIVSNLELVDSKIETAASRLNALQELFYTLLRELMTAKMRTCNLRLSAAQLSC